MKKDKIVEFINHNLDIISGDKPEIDPVNAVTRQKSTTDQIVQSSRQSNSGSYYNQMGFQAFMGENNATTGETKDIILESKLIEDYITSFCNNDDINSTDFTNPKYKDICNKICDIFVKTTPTDQFTLILNLLNSFNVSELPVEMKFILIKKFSSNNPTITEQ